MKIVLDFKSVKRKADIFEVFQKAFEFAYAPKGFDSLADSLQSLDTESQVYIDQNGKITLEVKNLPALKSILPGEYKIVAELIKKTYACLLI